MEGKHPFESIQILEIAEICKEKQKTKISIAEQEAMSTDFVSALVKQRELCRFLSTLVF